MKRLIPLLAVTMLLVGCGPSKSEYFALQEENEALKSAQLRLSESHDRLMEENQALTDELSILTTGPKKLYGDLLAAMELKDYATAFKQGKTLLDRFPQTTEAIRARNSVAYAQNILQTRAQQAKSRLKTQHDYATGTTWYYHKESDGHTHSPLFIYMGLKDDTLSLRLRVQRSALSGSRWQGFEVLTDHESFKIVLDSGDIAQRAVAGGVWQWYDIEAGAKERRMINAVKQSQVNRIIFFGDDAQEIGITAAERRMMAEVLAAYDALSHYPLAP